MLVEPGGCPGTFTDEQITTLATIPILAVFGDHRDTPTASASDLRGSCPSRVVRHSLHASRLPVARRRCSTRQTVASAATAT